MESKRIAVLGAGNMGTALLRGMLKAKWAKPDNLMATHPRKQRVEEIRRTLGIDASVSNVEAARWADVVVLAVKPQIAHRVLREIAPAMGRGKTLVSIAAGVTTRAIELMLPEVSVVRAMPNVAVTVDLGATAICRGTRATDADYDVARHVFEAVGIAVEVEEALMDAVTGLSGTGPMYVFQIIEGLSDAGVKMGLSRHAATELTIQTVLGAAKMAQVTGQHPGLLKDLVTSPGGTAIAALHSLEQGGLRALLIDAVEVATQRSAELGRNMEERAGTK
ncbi:MAG TPA: pyrroline-5-carboxylate reductase [Candidatus Thermoplasmatota archaeon]|nr:pyrroline-5-carboxylate reductase [Candidatus Thermoplasmatota archaeon]